MRRWAHQLAAPGMKLLHWKVRRCQRLQSRPQAIWIDVQECADRFEGKHVRGAARKKPCARIDEFGPASGRTAVLGAHIAAQRILEDRKEQLELAAGRMPTRYALVVLNRQKRVVVAWFSGLM